MSMQLCDTDDEEEGEPGEGGAADVDHDEQQQQPGGGGWGAEGAAAEDPNALVWYQCVHAVKGMHQAKQPGAG